MRISRLIMIITGLLVTGILTVSAANIHLHYFESVDAFLTDERFQRYSFSALEGEEITIVAYGLENETIPALTVFDTLGSTLIENQNENSLPAVAVQFTAEENGIYTFLVSRQTDAGGLIRVMVFEGDPIIEDKTLQDTIDPLLPARAYLFGGDETDPVEIQISVVSDDNPDTPAPEVFASRGTDVELPPLEERTTPVRSREWENTESERIYTLNVRALPEPVAHVNGFFSRKKQEIGTAILQLDIEEGGEPEILERPICRAFIIEDLQSYTGPNPDAYTPASAFQSGQEVEIVGFNGEFFLIVDPDSPTGGSWIPSVSVEIPGGLESADCSRVVEVDAPPVEETEEPPTDNQPAGTVQQTATPTPDPSTNWCYDPAKWGDGRCDAGTPEEDDWYWKCGYHMAQFERDGNRENVHSDCVSLLPPLPTAVPPTDIPATATPDLTGF